MSVKINTAIVLNTATRIKSINSTIRDDFSTVVNSINTLNRNWDGSASDNAIRAFNTIKETYCENRYRVIDDLTVFLKKSVATSYEVTEQNVQNAASAFK